MLSTMLIATLSVHLGLSDAVAPIISKIIKCPRCLSMWLTFIALLFHGSDIVFAGALSLLVAFVSNYFIFVLLFLNKFYEWLWERINNQKK